MVAWIVSLGRWNQWVLSILPYVQGDRVLEVGHGPGHLQVALSKQGLKPIGLDASWQMVRLAFCRLRRHLHNPCMVNAYTQFIPFRSHSFDTVIATFPTEFIYSSDSLAEFLRILKPEGILLVLPAATLNRTHLLNRALFWLFRITRQAPEHLDKDFINQISAPFIRSGFSVAARILSLADSQVLLLTCSPASTESSKLDAPIFQ